MIDDRFHRRRDDDNNDRRDRCSQRASERAPGRAGLPGTHPPEQWAPRHNLSQPRSPRAPSLEKQARGIRVESEPCRVLLARNPPDSDRSIDHSVGRPSARSWTAAAAAAAGLARSLGPWLHHERCPHGMSASMSACMSAFLAKVGSRYLKDHGSR